MTRPADPAGAGPGAVPSKQESEIAMRQIITAAAAALFVAGCSARGSFACDIVDKSGPTTTHRCSVLDSLDATQEQDAEDACPLLGGVVVDACTTEGQIGVCTLVSDGATQTIHFYADGSATAAESEASCKKLAGTWTGS
jgi:hypothetical protein